MIYNLKPHPFYLGHFNLYQGELPKICPFAQPFNVMVSELTKQTQTVLPLCGTHCALSKLRPVQPSEKYEQVLELNCTEGGTTYLITKPEEEQPLRLFKP